MVAGFDKFIVQMWLFWDLHEDSFEWYMKTAHMKWKEFKSDLKKEYYDETLEYNEEYDELIASCDDRVDAEQWKWIVDHWMTPEAKARSIRGKSNRKKHTQVHTVGSKSYVCVDEEMTKELGRCPRRDQLFIKTHEHKTGVPHKESIEIIAKLRNEAKEHLELLEKSMQEGHLFAFVCGSEKNGYARAVGLGPTSANLCRIQLLNMMSMKMLPILA